METPDGFFVLENFDNIDGVLFRTRTMMAGQHVDQTWNDCSNTKIGVASAISGSGMTPIAHSAALNDTSAEDTDIRQVMRSRRIGAFICEP